MCVLIAILIWGGLFGLRHFLVQTSLKTKINVNTITVKSEDLYDSEKVDGVIQAHVLQSYYAGVNGYINDIFFENGDSVCEGDIVFEYDITDAEYAYNAAEIDYTIASDNYKIQKASGDQATLNIAKYNENKQVIENNISNLETEYGIVEKSYVANSNEGTQIRKKIQELSYELQNTELLETERIIKQEELEKCNIRLIELQSDSEFSSYCLSESKSNLSVINNLILSDKALENTNSTLDILKNQKKKAEENVQQLKEILDKQEQGISIKEQGKLDNLTLHEGEYIQRGQHLFDVISDTKYEIVVYINSSDVWKIQEGDSVSFTVNNSEKKGVVEHISNTVTVGASGAKVVEVIIYFDADNQTYIMGTDVTIEIRAEIIKNTISLPINAIKSDNKGDFVYLCKNSLIEKRYVTTGTIVESKIEIVSGIDVNDVVVISSDQAITEGDYVLVSEKTYD